MDDVNSLREYAWKYFELHANQRTLLFRFYVTFITFFISGLGILLLKFQNKGTGEEAAAALLSILLIITAYVFKKLDQRNSLLIDDAKSALIYLESKIDITLIPENERSNISILSNDANRNKKYPLSTHTSCFNLVFNISIGIGLIILFIALSRMGVFKCVYNCITGHN